MISLSIQEAGSELPTSGGASKRRRLQEEAAAEAEQKTAKIKLETARLQLETAKVQQQQRQLPQHASPVTPAVAANSGARATASDSPSAAAGPTPPLPHVHPTHTYCDLIKFKEYFPTGNTTQFSQACLMALSIAPPEALIGSPFLHSESLSPLLEHAGVKLCNAGKDCKCRRPCGKKLTDGGDYESDA